MAIEIVDLPTEHGDFPSFFVKVYQRLDDSMMVNTIIVTDDPNVQTFGCI